MGLGTRPGLKLGPWGTVRESLGRADGPAFSVPRLFYFYIFQKYFYRNIFSISQFTVLYPYRPAGGRQGACRLAGGWQGLICKIKKLFARKPLAGACRPPAGRQAPCHPVDWRQGGGRLPPRASAQIIFFNLHISPCRPAAGRQAPCRPPAGR